MVCIANLVVNVSYVGGQHNFFKAIANIRHKTTQTGHQGRQADKTARLTRQSGLLALFCACLVCLVPVTSPLVLLKWMVYKLICVE